jgi:hypothetical protein
MRRAFSWILGAAALGVGGYYALLGLQEKRRQVQAALTEAQHASASAREALAHTEAAARQAREVL